MGSINSGYAPATARACTLETASPLTATAPRPGAPTRMTRQTRATPPPGSACAPESTRSWSRTSAPSLQARQTAMNSPSRGKVTARTPGPAPLPQNSSAPLTFPKRYPLKPGASPHLTPRTGRTPPPRAFWATSMATAAPTFSNTPSWRTPRPAASSTAPQLRSWTPPGPATSACASAAPRLRTHLHRRSQRRPRHLVQLRPR